jgi:hypothetical protein
VRLAIRDLPEHRLVRLSLELAVLRTWDGNATGAIGPDVWSLRVSGGPVLYETTFDNRDGGDGSQAYPDGYPWGEHPSFTGSAERGTVGYGAAGRGGDAVYALRCAFPHRGTTLELELSASGLESLANESWGVDGVRVEVLPAFEERSEEELRGLWEDLGAGDPIRAEEAVWALAATGAAGARFVRERLEEYRVPEGEILSPVEEMELDTFRLAAEGTDARARVAYLDGRILQLRGRHGEAAARFREAIAEDDVSPWPRQRLAESLRAAGDAASSVGSSTR